MRDDQRYLVGITRRDRKEETPETETNRAWKTEQKRVSEGEVKDGNYDGRIVLRETSKGQG